MSFSFTPRAFRLAVFFMLSLFALSFGPVSAQDGTESPATETPATEVPATEVPVTEIPVTEIPVTEVPPSEEPAEEPEYYWIKVAAVLCQDRSCLELGERIGDLSITAVDIHTRESFGSCVTDLDSETQGCELEVPVDSQWTLVYDEGQTPDGYEYKGSVIGVEGGAHGSITYIPFIPLTTDHAPAPPVAQLPATGATGPDAAGIWSPGTFTLAAATLALSGTALRFRNR